MLGGGAGHLMDMISRLNANNAMRRKSSYFKIKKDFLNTAKGLKITYGVVGYFLFQ